MIQASSQQLPVDSIRLRIAAQLVGVSWRLRLEKAAQALDSQLPWDQAIEQATGARNDELTSILKAATQSGKPTETVLEILQHRQSTRQLWRRLLSSLLYPTVLILVALIVASLCGTIFTLVPQEFPIKESGFRDFAQMTIGSLLTIVWGIGVLLIVYVVAAPNTQLKIYGSLPIFGRPYRWLTLSELLSRLSTFCRFQPELSSALNLTAESFGNHACAAITHRLAERVRNGETLAYAIHQTVLSDDRVGAVLTLIDNESDTFRSSIEQSSGLLSHMAKHLCHRHTLLLPPLAILIAASLAFGAWSCFGQILSMTMSFLM